MNSINNGVQDPMRWKKVAVICVLYTVCWCTLDYAAYLFEVSPGVSPWYPPHALTLFLFLRFGLRYLPMAFVGPEIMGNLTWGPGEFVLIAAMSAGIAFSYGMCGWLLLKLNFDQRFTSTRDTAIFVVLGTIASFLTAFIGIAVQVWCGFLEPALFYRRIVEFGAGDTVGVLCMTPAFLVAANYRWKSARAVFTSFDLRTTAFFFFCGIVTFLAPFTFGIFENPPLYLLFVPMIAIALKYAIPGVSIYILLVNLSTITILRTFEVPVAIADLQLMMTTISISGLFIGSLVFASRAKLQLETRNANMEYFSYMVGHDIQSPLRVLLAHADKARIQHPSESISQVIRIGTQIRILVDSLSQYLLASSKSVGQEEKVSLNKIVKASLAQSQRFNSEKVAEVNIGNLPTVVGNKSLLTALFLNLIENALKFSPSKGAKIEVGSFKDGSTDVYFVSNLGTPIEEKHAKEIFQPMKQLGVSAGLGLGLAICQKITDLHGGFIWLDTKYTEGSRFCFTLGVNKKNGNS